MQKTKRLTCFLFLVLLLVLALAFTACGGGNDNDNDTNGTQADDQQAGQDDGQADITAPDDDDEEQDDAQEDFFEEDFTGEATQLIADVLAARTPVTITYANWNIAEPMEMLMVEEFMYRYDFITVEIVYTESGAHMENLQALSMAGNLPDVFAISRVPDMIASGFLRDILPYGQQFDDWVHVPAISLSAVQHRGRVFAMPFSTHYQGFVVNDALWDANNLPRLEIGFSLETLLHDLRVITDIPNGIGGTTDWIQFARGWLPNYFDNSFGPHTWDGERLQLNHPAYIEAINFTRQLREEGLVVSPGWLSEAEWDAFNAGWWFDVFSRGDMASMIEGSWWIGTWTNLYRQGMDVRFVGLPGGTVALTPTYAGISIQSENPAVAMHFLNWMAFGADGINHRIDLRDYGRGYTNDYGDPITYPLGFLPPTVNPQILRRYFDGEIPGIEEAMLANMHNAVIEGEAILPGHVQALFGGNTGLTVVVDGELVENATVSQVVTSAIQGNLNFADYADAINDFANTQVALMRDEINFMLDMMGLTE